jgi:hypothetical protein
MKILWCFKLGREERERDVLVREKCVLKSE